MSISRLGFAVSQFPKLNRPASVLLQRNFASKHDVEDGDADKPIRYSTTAAAKWKAVYHRAPPNERVWFTPYAVSLSVASFLIYFCILREENDLDEFIYRPLPETIEGIEKSYPGFDFYQKPDHVVYHEKNKEEKIKAKEAKKSNTGRTIINLTN